MAGMESRGPVNNHHNPNLDRLPPQDTLPP
jgi:hypothetical protein